MQKQPITDQVLMAEYQALFRYVLSLCHEEQEALDITQETMLRAMQARDRFAEQSSLYTWLCAIARNEWLNRCKRTKTEVLTDDPVSAQSLENDLVQKDLSLHIHRIVHSLEEPYKEVFSLRVFGELPFADIASLFSKSESWARVTFHRARYRILEILGREDIV